MSERLQNLKVNQEIVYMKVGGEGVETKIMDGIAYSLSNKNDGIPNSEDPFDELTV